MRTDDRNAIADALEMLAGIDDGEYTNRDELARLAKLVREEGTAERVQVDVDQLVGKTVRSVETSPDYVMATFTDGTTLYMDDPSVYTDPPEEA